MISPLNAIAAKREEIRTEIDRLKAEDADLVRAEEVLSRLNPGQAPAASARLKAPRQEPVRASLAHRPPKSHRELVIAALGHAPKPWLRSNDIIEIANQRWGAVIADKSLRPLLTVMKREGVIVRDGRWVALRERARDKGRAVG
jgi:hypothetical protein